MGGLLSGPSTGAVLMIVLATAIPSFFLGTVVTLYAGIDCVTRGGKGNTADTQPINDALIENRVQQRMKELNCDPNQQQQQQQQHSSQSASSFDPLFSSDNFGRFLVDMAHVSKEDFTRYIDPGVPLDPPQKGGDHVALFYSHEGAKPSSLSPNQSVNGSNPFNQHLEMPDALENCEQLNIILADQTGVRKQCFAIMPQYESFHLQRWMRTNPKFGAVDMTQPLQFVSRGHARNGKEEFGAPKLDITKKHWDWLQKYLANLDDVLAEVDVILKKIATKDNKVIVLVCNFGQSELLMNFVCSAKARGFDLSPVIVFTTDQETTDLAQSLGLATYYDERVSNVHAFPCSPFDFISQTALFSLVCQNFGDIPSEAAEVYGDPKFIAMMMAKVVCVQVVSMLGYDLLFQDVDIVWYKDPLDYFRRDDVQQYDIFFQDDGGHSLRYAPYSANSGFYFVRHNERTRHLLSQLLVTGDLVLSTRSHQAALIALLSEHVSLHGLRAKVLARDTEEFPGGYHFNQRSGKYMRDFFAGTVHPYIFHMSWTKNKANKLLYLRQMGEWWVKDKCIEKKKEDILRSEAGEAADVGAVCCAAEPLVSCHYRDKPSKIPCRDSPSIDKGTKSFW